jgi:cellulose 1,4-beta-cellobiosidase
MKFTTAVLSAALASVALAAPAKRAAATATAACASAVTLTGNPFASKTLHPNAFYRAEVSAAVQSLSDQSLASSAAKVADVGTFLWLYV